MKKIIISLIVLIIFSAAADAQIVNIPDANFKAILVGNAAVNTNGDTEIQISEASTFTGAISCSSGLIADLTGIEEFTALTILACSNNSISILDISQNTALTVLHCHNNNLTALDISQNSDLSILFCNLNSLTALDVSQNTDLTQLDCQTNNIMSLDVSQNSNLWSLKCSLNALSTLDVSQNVLLTDFYCGANDLAVLNMKNISTTTLVNFNATANPNLSCIDVDDVAAATAAWTLIDVGVGYSLNCVIDLVTSIIVQGQAGVSTITVQGGSLQMEAAVLPINADDDTYTWSVSNGTGSAIISASGLLTATANGTVTVKATANDASGTTGTAIVTISNQDLGISEQSNIHSLTLYPNPAKSTITLNAVEKIETIVIIDIMGKSVKMNSTANNTIDISDLIKGIYFLQVDIGGTLVSEKFIKE
ncbi:MAG: hypothetical protein ACI8XB_001741 [Patiriisocius sp.]|jgi:hypothetical protein